MNSKLNMKSASFGSPVDWHQDWAFLPHTNDDLLAVGVMIDDVDEENGPLMVFPASHKGPIFDHHAEGMFCGAIDLRRDGFNVADAIKLMGPAGSLSLHHVRLVHGSDLNRTARDRRILFYEVASADAWPLVGTTVASRWTDLKAFDALMISGSSIVEPRMTAVPLRMPQPNNGLRSIYQDQKTIRHTHFERYVEKAEVS